MKLKTDRLLSLRERRPGVGAWIFDPQSRRSASGKLHNRASAVVAGKSSRRLPTGAAAESDAALRGRYASASGGPARWVRTKDARWSKFFKPNNQI